ncbi:hypothetical protein V6N13_014139 [Hibiscus sabdariffa]
MAEEETELSDEQKKGIAKWFLINAPTGEIQYVAKDFKSVLKDDDVFNEAASEAFPIYNKSHLICLKMPGGYGDFETKPVLVTYTHVTVYVLMTGFFILFRRTMWIIAFKDDMQVLELKGKWQELRRKLLVTRTLFPWHNTLRFDLKREMAEELGIRKRPYDIKQA